MQTRYAFATRLPLLARLGGTTLVVYLLWLAVIIGGNAGCAFLTEIATRATRLSGTNQVPPTPSVGWGNGWYELSVNRIDGAAILTLSFGISGGGLSGMVTGAHFHHGPVGVNGDIVFDLSGLVSELEGEHIDFSYSAVVPLEDWLIDDAAEQLLAGNIYVSLKTETYPEGEIRGQVIIPEDGFRATRLSGTNQVPPTPSVGWGYGVYELYLNEDLTGLFLDITGGDLSGMVTGAHLHHGPVGVNGDIVFDLSGSVTKLEGEFSLSADVRLEDDEAEQLLAGNIYVSVKTETYPEGEIRGQVIINSFGL